MVDISSVSATLGVLKDITNQVKLFSNLTEDIENKTKIQEAKRVAIDLTNAVITLQTEMLSLQSAYSQLVEENRKLNSEIQDKEKYKLVRYPTELSKEILVYKYMGDDEPEHYLCPHCWGYGNKTILQKQKSRASHDGLKCIRCNWWHCI